MGCEIVSAIKTSKQPTLPCFVRSVTQSGMPRSLYSASPSRKCLVNGITAEVDFDAGNLTGLQALETMNRVRLDRQANKLKSREMNALVPILLVITAGISVASFCVFCLARPDTVASYVRRRYLRSSKLVQKWPFANLVMKPWYPGYLRIMGLFGFVFTLVWLYLAVALLKGQWRMR